MCCAGSKSSGFLMSRPQIDTPTIRPSAPVEGGARIDADAASTCREGERGEMRAGSGAPVVLAVLATADARAIVASISC